MLSVQELHKSFDGVEVLRGVSAEIDKGDVVCIIGPSGSGKSTFLRCLNRMEQPDSGKIFLDGVELTAKKVDLDRQRQKMGMVFQQFNLFPNMTVLRNLTLAPTLLKKMPRAEAEAKAMELLERVGLADRAGEYPDRLSGGQKQRIAIAGILAMEPECIVLDEATAMLDPAGRREVIDTVLRLNREQGITVVLITHHMVEAERADRVIVMNDGEVAMDGMPRQVFSQVERLHELGLAAPDTVELLYRLRRDGVDVPLENLTVDECADTICRAFGGAEGK